MRMSLVIVQTIFNQLRLGAKSLPDFVNSMIEFSTELEKQWLKMNEIERKLETLVEGTTLSREREDELANLENQANELYVRILRKKIDFRRHWKPSFQMHRDPKSFEKFARLVTEILEENMLPISEGLRFALRSRSEWIRARKTEKIEQRLRYMTLILTLVIFAEVLIGCAQIFPSFAILFTVLAILTPISLVLVGYFLLKQTS